MDCKKTIAPLLLCALAGLARAAEPAPNPAASGPELFYARQQVVHAELSPSGNFVAVTTSRGSKRVDLAVFQLKPQLRGARLVHEDGADIASFSWVGEDKLVYSLTDLDTAWGDREYKGSGLFAVDLAGHKRQLISRTYIPDELRIQADIKTLTGIHFLLSVPPPQAGLNADEVIVGKAMSVKDKHVNWVRPQWLNVREGTTRPMDLGSNPPEASEWWFDNKGVARVARSFVEGRHVYEVRMPGQDEWKRFGNEDREAIGNLIGTDEGGQLFIVRNTGARRERALFRADPQTLRATGEPVLQMPGFDVNPELIRGEPGQPILGVRYESDLRGTLWFDPAMQAFQREVDERFPRHVNEISCRRCGRPDMVALVFSSSDRDPGSFWVYDAGTQAWQNIGERRDDIDPSRMASVTFDRIKARDGEDLPVWLTLPAGWKRGAPPAPAVVMVHGGPWSRTGHWQWQAREQFLASRGYLVISPEFRGSTGYGAKHREAGNRQWGRAMQDDVADALLWAQAKGLASRQACIAGGSYGGYSTLMGLVRDPGLFSCGAAWVAVADLSLLLKGDWSTSDDINDYSRSIAYRESIGDAVADAEMLKAVSPLEQAARIKAPLLLIYGKQDQRVPVEHGERLRAAMQAAGNPPEWKVFKDDVHGFTNLENQAEFARTLDAFLARHLKKAPEPQAAVSAQ